MDKSLIERLQGPILVLGASGFVGANLFKRILEIRNDVFGTAQQLPSWRLEQVDRNRILVTDLLVPSNLQSLFDRVSPMTIFDCVAYGAYSFEEDPSLIYQTNFILTTQLLQAAERRKVAAFVHCGSASEYGLNSSAPSEKDPLEPNSHYAVSKCASAYLLRYYGKIKRVPCVNLRLYSVYGPEEDAARLIPAVVDNASRGSHPPFVHPDVGHDFVYSDDVTEALVKAALYLKPDGYGESFNIGSGRSTTIRELADLSKALFAIAKEPAFSSMPNRNWDVKGCVADAGKAAAQLDWRATTSLADGLKKTMDWFMALEDKQAYQRSSKSRQVDYRRSISAVIACYGDEPAIPIMYQRLVTVFRKLGVDYEIIFVNDGSPDDSENVIRELSLKDRHVVGISHARNFGSQAAFRSGMKLSSKASCVLLDGDLQDPPELIEAFLQKWREGFDVVYGLRVGRDAPWLMNLCYKAFYRVFNKLSYIHVPKDAGDFSLMDRQVVDWLLRFPERDIFMRGLRAFVGFRQTGIGYHRPERQFGRSTNSLFRNLGWAKRGILSFSNVPLNALTAFSFAMVALTSALACGQILFRLIWPSATPSGLTTVILAVMGFGSLNLLGLSVIGEYIAKIFEESKERPHYIRRALIRNGHLQRNLNES